MKKAGQILCDYVPMGSTDNGRDCWAQEQVLGAMEEYAKQFKTNKLYEFVYCGMTEESSYATISVHRTREGAEKAMNKHKEEERIKHEKKIERYKNSWKEEGHDDETIKELLEGSTGEFGRFEDWGINEIEVED